jgi:hypothetical protein
MFASMFASIVVTVFLLVAFGVIGLLAGAVLLYLFLRNSPKTAKKVEDATGSFVTNRKPITR